MDSMKGNARNRRNQTQEVDFGVLRAGERTGSWSVRGSELRAGETGRTFATSVGAGRRWVLGGGRRGVNISQG